MKQLIVLCGPAGSGKSTLAKEYEAKGFVRISQDDDGREGHLTKFKAHGEAGDNMVIDRMSFNREQRDRYLIPAKANGYTTKIIVLHVPQAVCLERALKRISAEGHPTIQDEKSARSALHTFFTKYQRPTEDEADEIEFVYPEGNKPPCIGIDLDGTLCDIDHRLHFVQGEGKKDWKNFLYNIPGDSVNEWCRSLIEGMSRAGYQVVYCSGRGGEYRGQTKTWLQENALFHFCEYNETHLYMRERGDHRADTVIKEILLDFEILTRFTPVFFVDDRPSVCRLWRSRGFKCLQINDVEF